MTPDGGRGEVRPAARAATPTSPRSSARAATTCPASPGWATRPPPSGSREYGGLDGIVANGSTRSAARPGTSLRTHLDGVMRNRRLNRLVGDLELAGRRSTTCRARLGPRGRCTRSSTGWSSACCASGSSRRWRRAEPEAEGGFDARRRRGWPAGEVAGWLAEHATGGAGRCTSSGTWGARAPGTRGARARHRRTAPPPTSTSRR